MQFSFKYTRWSAVAQTFLGFSLVMFGIADRAIMYRYAFHTISVAPIWMGVWIKVTGVVGLLGTRRYYANQNNSPSAALIGTYLGFSVTSVVFAGAMIILYIIGIHWNYGRDLCNFRYLYYNHYEFHLNDERRCKTSVALGSMVVIFAILEFGFGIMACVCSCMNGCCDCCYPSATQLQGQIIYLQNYPQGATQNVITQDANGVPVVVPAQGAVPMPSQAQSVPSAQVIDPIPSNVGAVMDGAVAGYSQSPPFEHKHRDMLPIYHA